MLEPNMGCDASAEALKHFKTHIIINIFTYIIIYIIISYIRLLDY